jgi:IrrE N-terminal-like domain
MIFRNDEDYEKHSQKLRSDLGIEGRFCVDTLYCARRLKEIGRIADFKVVHDETMPRDSAKYDGADRILLVPERTIRALDVVGNASKPERRHQRFTLAHEFAHVVQEVPGDRYRGPSGALAERTDFSIRLDEIQANRFASAFLIPSNLANPSYSAEHLSELFDVNLRVADIRREQLEKLRRRAADEPRALPPGVFNYLRNAKKKGFDVRSLDREIFRQRSAAKANGYEDCECSRCGNFTVRRESVRFKCETCGSETRNT